MRHGWRLQTSRHSLHGSLFSQLAFDVFWSPWEFEVRWRKIGFDNNNNSFVSRMQAQICGKAQLHQRLYFAVVGRDAAVSYLDYQMQHRCHVGVAVGPDSAVRNGLACELNTKTSHLLYNMSH